MRNEQSAAMAARDAAVLVLALAISLSLPVIARAADASGKKHHRQQGYGFLPGYVPPGQFDPLRARPYGPGYWYGYPGFYKGRWNGGGFGPCWTQTPIGNVWNCG
jgi:hypothetical protein